MAAQPSLATLADRLPEEAADFRRGAVVPRPDGGLEIGYRTTGRTAAGAMVALYRPAGPADAAAVEAALEDLLRDALLPRPTRNLREIGRLTLPDPRPEAGPGAAPPGLRCAETAGRYGRERVAGLLCAGAAGGSLLRLRIGMPDRDPPPGDARAFAAAILAALRGS
ncbi:hypothetical protein ACFQU2_10345 [Siccirubricoccus deserti]